jgi:hypothetical protein
MARPETAMVAPAITLTHRSNGFVLIRLSPSLNASTTVIIVAMVTAENRIDTRITPWILFFSCGIHKDGYQRFTGSEDKYQEKDPWCEVFPVRKVYM